MFVEVGTIPVGSPSKVIVPVRTDVVIEREKGLLIVAVGNPPLESALEVVMTFDVFVAAVVAPGVLAVFAVIVALKTDHDDMIDDGIGAMSKFRSAQYPSQSEIENVPPSP